MGYAAPALRKELGVEASVFGAVFSAANVGVLIGSIVFSALADRIGRRPILVWMTLFFALMTLATAQAQTVTQLFWLRLVSGIGLGSIMPNATALIGEFSPANKRVTLMMCITVGFNAGAAIGGFIAAALIPAFGWQSVFYFGGTIPLIVGALMAAALPESIEFLVVRRRHLDKVGRWLRAIDPTLRLDAHTDYVAHRERRRRGAPFIHLFTEGRATATILLWVANFMNLLNLYALSNWLATIVDSMGYDTRTAVLVSTTLQVGGVIGTFGLAWLVSRRGFTATLMSSFAIATLTIFVIGRPGVSLAWLVILIFVAGWCVLGGQGGLNAFEATLYPTDLRSTGIGWALGVGRTGAIVGPYVGGMLMANHWTTQQLFMAAALPALVSTITMLGLRIVTRDSRTRDAV
jgi:AAHS family 4-hydroxybenzoate transporter-like MFS transporter